MLIRQEKVWEGPVLLQSITAGSVLEDGLHLYEGLYRLPDADKVPGAPDLPVSYTHLDVYKRQASSCLPLSKAPAGRPARSLFETTIS